MDRDEGTGVLVQRIVRAIDFMRTRWSSSKILTSDGVMKKKKDKHRCPGQSVYIYCQLALILACSPRSHYECRNHQAFDTNADEAITPITAALRVSDHRRMQLL